MAGHSKFANIKHKKAKNDAVRGKIFTKLGREIAVAVKLGGSDPDENSRLRDVVTKAKQNNMPNDTIERSIKKASGNLEGVSYEEITYEGYGPNGIAIIVETLTDNKNRTAANVRHAFTKGEGNLGTTGCVSFMFIQVGQIMIEKSDNIDEDELMMLVVEYGANDFNVEDEGYEIITSVENFSKVRQKLEDAKIPMIEAEITRLPDNYIEILEEEVIKNMEKLLDLLEEDDDVQHVYHNWDE